MSDDDHPHFCECCGCLNRGGGLVLAGMGVTYPDEVKWKGPKHRAFLREKRRERAERKARIEGRAA